MRCVLIKCGVYLQNWVYSSGPKFYLLFSMVLIIPNRRQVYRFAPSLFHYQTHPFLAIQIFFFKKHYGEKEDDTTPKLGLGIF